MIVGSLSFQEAQLAKRFAKAMDWPLLCDPQSEISFQWAHLDLWLQHPKACEQRNQAQCVVQFGSRIVSKRLLQWLEARCAAGLGEYHYIAPHSAPTNPWHAMQQQWVCEISHWVDVVLSKRLEGQHTQQGWADEFTHYAQSVRQLAQLHSPLLP